MGKQNRASAKNHKSMNKELGYIDLANEVINALGNEHFDPDPVVIALAKAAKEVQESGGNPGSFWAVANLLPSVSSLAKKLY